MFFRRLVISFICIFILEKSLFAQTAKSTSLMPDISVIGSMGGGYFTTDPSTDVGHDPARTEFTLQEIELALSSVIDPYLRGDVFFSFHESGVELEGGYVTTLALPYQLQVKAGKFLMPFGRQNQKHLHRWDFADTMLVNKAFFGPEGLSELGINLSYLFLPPSFFSWKVLWRMEIIQVVLPGLGKKIFSIKGVFRQVLICLMISHF
ncbi:MAG: hypothetical protein IPJ69_07495 [Deltaproteobacteria bacterium]|nr:MAG: hypothetical protein IPJ69_07495 [Deltaproteobacteria bacterium]